ncbi:hypothetical protein CHLRE_13g585200v5 [Chlamydomonas reinhardtii]|uniref:Uncharacterized protein n=1 Tax=Chlamydomonas reinhardtii TaxID=3055 RepID=A0A2K3D0N3_CHLRE|nr:uncharacterized protein CHLRE_13g585200v5 [Chlamydomonas reinhardtii]PNW74100.1 hypothetical protein CHLRE_13g585200v5 [Chlamydomonas reinhardtii]
MLRSILSRGNAASQRPVVACARPTKAAAVLSAAKAMQHQSAAVLRLGGSARSDVAAAAAAADPDGEAEEIVKILAAIPPEHRMPLFKLLWKLNAQSLGFLSRITAKADELTAMAKDNATMTEQLYTTKQQLLVALSAAGVFNARSFLEYVANQWRKEQAGGSAKKRQGVFKDGLRMRPDLVLCLLRDVPSWASASMTDEQKGACVGGGHLYCAASHAHDSDPQAAVASNRVVWGSVGALACFSVSS